MTSKNSSTMLEMLFPSLSAEISLPSSLLGAGAGAGAGEGEWAGACWTARGAETEAAAEAAGRSCLSGLVGSGVVSRSLGPLVAGERVSELPRRAKGLEVTVGAAAGVAFLKLLGARETGAPAWEAPNSFEKPAFE